MHWVSLALFFFQPVWQEHNRRGEDAFKRADIDVSIREFDKAIEIEPRLSPHHWQRGISLYYANRFADCAKQFEIHRTVNPEDVENAVWHYLCLARAKNPAAARKQFIPISADDRPAMMEVHALFAGRSTAEKVIAAAGSNRSGLFYAHLYVGLYYEAQGERAKAVEHIRRAATEYPSDHYMGDVARVHLKLAK